jgi:hypothetical protein
LALLEPFRVDVSLLFTSALLGCPSLAYPDFVVAIRALVNDPDNRGIVTANEYHDQADTGQPGQRPRLEANPMLHAAKTCTFLDNISGTVFPEAR